MNIDFKVDDVICGVTFSRWSELTPNDVGEYLTRVGWKLTSLKFGYETFTIYKDGRSNSVVFANFFSPDYYSCLMKSICDVALFENLPTSDLVSKMTIINREKVCHGMGAR